MSTKHKQIPIWYVIYAGHSVNIADRRTPHKINVNTVKSFYKPELLSLFNIGNMIILENIISIKQ
jgi:hypothetical protein